MHETVRRSCTPQAQPPVAHDLEPQIADLVRAGMGRCFSGMHSVNLDRLVRSALAPTARLTSSRPSDVLPPRSDTSAPPTWSGGVPGESIQNRGVLIGSG